MIANAEGRPKEKRATKAESHCEPDSLDSPSHRRNAPKNILVALATLYLMRPELIKAAELLRRNTPEDAEEAIALVQSTVYSFSMKVCGHPEDAEDISQEDEEQYGSESYPSQSYEVCHSIKISFDYLRPTDGERRGGQRNDATGVVARFAGLMCRVLCFAVPQDSQPR